MKRTLINFDVLKRMEEDSLSSAEAELALAEDIVSSALDQDISGLHSFTREEVIYETRDGNFIHANYKIDNDSILLENIEELVIDEESEKQEARQALAKMVEMILDGKDEEASEAFAEYINLPFVERSFNEGFKVVKSNPTGGRSKLFGKKQSTSLINARTRGRKKSLAKRSPGQKAAAKRARDRVKGSLGGNKRARAILRWDKPKKKKMVSECLNLCESVTDYINYREFGPVLDIVQSRLDESSNVEALKIPTYKVRNEARILSFNWKTLDHKVKRHRSAGKNLSEDNNFCKAVADLKRSNAISDMDAIEESIDTIVAQWANVLYLTQNELSNIIGEALHTTGAKNYDDDMCNFMAEGILRKAHEAYTEKVDTITKLSGTTLKSEENQDAYEQFRGLVDGFYPTLDENASNEMQVFVDLYNAVRDVHEEAVSQRNDFVAEEAEDHLRELGAVVSQQINPDIELAEEVSDWLYDLLETNLGSSDWNVSNKPHMTVSGDHPDMAKKASQGYSPKGDFSGDWGDSAPVSDGKSYKNGLADQMRNRSWGNVGDNTDPGISNPYIPAGGDFTMKGEPGVDKSQDGLVYKSGNTWPELQNPYSPSAPGADGWRMKSDNLVIDQ